MVLYLNRNCATFITSAFVSYGLKAVIRCINMLEQLFDCWCFLGRQSVTQTRAFSRKPCSLKKKKKCILQKSHLGWVLYSSRLAVDIVSVCNH